jgi:DNA helicase-2/ATP-dependent DNA helicase PcrA
MRDKFNDEQWAAVSHPVGEPAALIAGAGSGKTHTLTGRVKYLIEQGVRPRSIVCLTFTNKAAEAMTSRLGITPETPIENTPRISTIHSLSLAFIRRNPSGFGLKQKVTPIDDYDQTQMMRKIIEREKSEEDAYRVLDRIRYHRARRVGFSHDYTEEIHEKALEAHAGYHALTPPQTKLWKLYEEEKLRQSVLDFDDMIHFSVQRGKKDAEWLRALQTLFQQVLTDESQDTAPIQWEFINMLLAPTNFNLFCVGDVSQSIYGFQGAEPELLMQYTEGWRGKVPAMYKIARNHRSVPQVVNLANAIQAKMTRTIPLKMESWRGLNGHNGETKTLKACLPSDVASGVATQIVRDSRLLSNPIFFKENCILVRAASQIRDIETELVRLRIPYIVRGGQGLLQTEEVRDILSYLKLATNESDFNALSRAAQAPKRGIGDVRLEKIRDLANQKYEGNLLKACNEAAPDKLGPFLDVIGEVQRAPSPVLALERAIGLVRYKEYLTERYKKDKNRVSTKLENLEQLALIMQGLIEDKMLSLEDIVFQLTMEKAAEDDELGKVVVSTIHSAKGLEWRRVYAMNLYDGSVPHKFSMGSEAEIDEERRLFYVACTRARDILVLCYPEMIQFKTNASAVFPSRFLTELGIAKG